LLRYSSDEYAHLPTFGSTINGEYYTFKILLEEQPTTDYRWVDYTKTGLKKLSPDASRLIDIAVFYFTEKKEFIQKALAK
jgi:hypothetical protein